jgi:hypothetical protein
MQFGGHVELDENPWQAIEHELLEESGYSFKQLKLLQPKQRMKSLSDATLHPQPVLLLTHTFDDIKHSHTDISYAFTTHESPKGVIGSSESTMLKEYTAAELRTVPAADILENAREESLYILEELLNTWVEVPAV